MAFIARGMHFAIAILGLGILVGNANGTLSSIDYASNSGDNWADASVSSFLVRAVPEPSTSILLLGGLVVLLGSRLRRSQHTRTG